jgi:cystathionine beta-lyase
MTTTDGAPLIEFLPVDTLDVLRRRTSAKWQSCAADVLPLTLAEMDFALAPEISTALEEAIARSDTGYAWPTPALGTALAGFAGVRWGWEIDPLAVTAVADVGVGVVELLRLITRSSDTVIVSPPVYAPFFGWVSEAGARLREVPLAHDENGWRLDLAALETAFADHPAAYLLCNPHNPVGRVHTAEELEALVALARRFGVVIISDEIHAPLVLPGASFTPLLTVPGAADVTISLLSASKAWNLAGLKCAVIVTASPAMGFIVERLQEAHWGVGQLGIVASIAAFGGSGDWLDRLLATLDARRSRLGELLSERLPALSWRPPEATYLAWIDCSDLGAAIDPAERFLERGRVAVQPGPKFGTGGTGHVRLNFATSEEILDQASAQMARSLG